MASKSKHGWKGHCYMCAIQKGKSKIEGQAARQPVPVRRMVGKRRRLLRHDLGDQLVSR